MRVSETTGAEDTVEIQPLEHTVELPAAPPPRLHPSTWLLFVTVAAAGLLAGIVLAAFVRPAPSGSTAARATVGPNGGTLVFDGKGILRIPAGALREAVPIVIRRSVVDERLRVRPPDGPLHVIQPNTLVAYTFEPAEASFTRPVSITLPLQQARRPGAVFSSIEGTVLFLDGTVDPDAGTITVEVTDFRFRAGRAPGAES